MSPALIWLRSFYPEESSGPLKENAIAAMAAGVGVLTVALLSSLWLQTPLPIVAAVGASACLAFCLPTSLPAQPWAIVMGYLVSGIAGVAAFKTGWPMPLAAAAAIALAAFAMLALRCLHPPGGAVALTAVVGGERITDLGFAYVLSPVLANATLIVLVALLLNNVLPGRHYPRRLSASKSHPRGFSGDDLHAALQDYGHPLPMAEEEFDAIISLAEAKAKARQGPDPASAAR